MSTPSSRNPIERGDEESTIRASVAELRRKREQEGDPFAERKARIIERAYPADHSAKDPARGKPRSKSAAQIGAQ